MPRARKRSGKWRMTKTTETGMTVVNERTSMVTKANDAQLAAAPDSDPRVTGSKIYTSRVRVGAGERQIR